MSEPRPPLTPAERAALRQLAEQATPGPWTTDHDGTAVDTLDAKQRVARNYPGWIVLPTDLDRLEDMFLAERQQLRSNSTYIAAISPDRLLALLDEVERLERDVRLHSTTSRRVR